MKTETKTQYHSNGKKHYEVPYINDKVHGLSIWWYENGNKYSETPFKKSIRHGVKIRFKY